MKDRGIELTPEQKAMIKEFEAEDELLDQRGLVRRPLDASSRLWWRFGTAWFEDTGRIDFSFDY